MITGFEEYTDELSALERDHIMEILKDALLLTDKERPLNNHELKRIVQTTELNTSAPRIRHMIHVLRVTDAIPCLVANSKGYYITKDRQELENYKQSLDDRLRSIYNVRRSIKRQLKALSQSAVQQRLFE